MSNLKLWLPHGFFQLPIIRKQKTVNAVQNSFVEKMSYKIETLVFYKFTNNFGNADFYARGLKKIWASKKYIKIIYFYLFLNHNKY